MPLGRRLRVLTCIATIYLRTRLNLLNSGLIRATCLGLLKSVIKRVTQHGDTEALKVFRRRHRVRSQLARRRGYLLVVLLDLTVRATRGLNASEHFERGAASDNSAIRVPLANVFTIRCLGGLVTAALREGVCRFTRVIVTYSRLRDLITRVLQIQDNRASARAEGHLNGTLRRFERYSGRTVILMAMQVSVLSGRYGLFVSATFGVFRLISSAIVITTTLASAYV